MSRGNLTKKEVIERNDKIFSDYKLLSDTGMLKMEIYKLLADRYGIMERNTISQIVYKKTKEEFKREQTKDIQKISKKDLLQYIKPDQNGNFSLTELWKLSSGDDQKAPAKWQESEPVQRFIVTACKILNIGISDIIKSKRGKGGGTYAHRQIFLEYAQYLDAELAVLVNEVFFERVEEEKNPDLAIDRGVRGYENKGKSAQWISRRLHAVGIRNLFTDTLKKHGIIDAKGFKTCTNAVYVGLFGKEAKEIREQRNLPEKCNLRENLSSIELAAISLAEELSIEDISSNNLFGINDCSVSAHRASRSVSQSIIAFRKRNNNVS